MQYVPLGASLFLLANPPEYVLWRRGVYVYLVCIYMFGPMQTQVVIIAVPKYNLCMRLNVAQDEGKHCR